MNDMARGAVAAAAALIVLFLHAPASAQSRTFGCSKGPPVTVTVTGPDAISAGPIEGQTLQMKKDPGNPLHFYWQDYAVKIAPNQTRITVEIPDWGAMDCRIGARAAAPAPGGAAAPRGPGAGGLPMDGQSLGGIVRSAPSLTAARVASLPESTPIVLLERALTMDGYSWFKINFNGRVGYQWGGIMCSMNPLNGIYKQCDQL